MSKKLSNMDMQAQLKTVGYGQSLGLSIALHIAILVLMSLTVIWHPFQGAHPAHTLDVQQDKTPIIQVTALDQTQVQETVDAITAQAARKAKAQAMQQANLRAQLHRALKAQEQQQAKVAKLQAAKKRLQQENAKQQSQQQQQAKALAQLKKKQAKALAMAKAAKAEQLKQAQIVQQAQAAAAHQAAVESKYAALIRSAIEHNWTYPSHTDKLTCVLALDLAPTGQVLSAHLIKSSGDPSIDRLAVTAVYKSSPLPVPKNPTDFAPFRHINLTVSTHN